MPPSPIKPVANNLRLLPDTSVVLLELAGRFALFHEARQQLFELNDSAAAIWISAADGQPAQIAIDAVVSAGVAPPLAAERVCGALDEWLNHGWLVPAEVVAILGGEPTATFPVCLCGRPIHD